MSMEAGSSFTHFLGPPPLDRRVPPSLGAGLKGHWSRRQEILLLVSVWPWAKYAINLAGLGFACIKS